MNNPKCLILPAILAAVLLVTCGKDVNQGPAPDSYGIDHACTDLGQIPNEWLDSVKALKVHYAHTSHGEQIIIGLGNIESADPVHSFNDSIGGLPVETGALCIFDGQEHEAYVTPDLYWQTAEGMNYTRTVLNNNPTIRVSLWCWCTQLDGYSAEEVQVYLDSMSALEAEFPNVTFVYMTGNAQAKEAEGYNRHLRNQQIRDYCRTNGKWLFDFADLDCWWFNSGSGEWEYSNYDHEGTWVPVEHPEFNGDEAGHTTNESCDQKGRAFWWLLARIMGWPG
jgi:hypothetical protein